MALALATIDVASRWGIPVETLTVDHGIREGSRVEAHAVSELASLLGATATIQSVSVNGGVGGPEANARQARLDALRQRARELGGGPRVPVLVGHTLEDQAETVLLRLARGSGTHSLKAMSADVTDDFSVRWMRPLLQTRRADTRQACLDAGVPWVEDPTNQPDGPWRGADGSPLRRAAVRSFALPSLADSLGMDPVPALGRTAQMAQEDDEALRGWADREYINARDKGTVDRNYHGGKSASRGENTVLENQRGDTTDQPLCAHQRVELFVEPLRELPVAVLSRVLGRLAREAGVRAGELSADHHRRMVSLVTHWHGQGSVALPGVRVWRQKDHQGRARIIAEVQH